MGAKPPASVCVFDQNGRTPLHVAARAGSSACLVQLMEVYKNISPTLAESKPPASSAPPLSSPNSSESNTVHPSGSVPLTLEGFVNAFAGSTDDAGVGGQYSLREQQKPKPVTPTSPPSLGWRFERKASGSSGSDSDGSGPGRFAAAGNVRALPRARELGRSAIRLVSMCRTPWSIHRMRRVSLHYTKVCVVPVKLTRHHCCLVYTV